MKKPNKTRAVPLIKGEKSNCRKNKASLTEPIIQEINTHYLPVIPAGERLKILQN